jgi:hypothetical protein
MTNEARKAADGVTLTRAEFETIKTSLKMDYRWNWLDELPEDFVPPMQQFTEAHEKSPRNPIETRRKL